MHLRARRAVSFALSLTLHALLLLLVFSWTVASPNFPIQAPMPVRILEPRPAPARRAPAAPKPPPVAPPPAAPPPVVQAPEPPAPPAEAPPAPEQQPPPPPPEKKIPLPEQIVSPPDAGKNEVPPDTRFKSDRDTKVEEQMVKRGQPKPGDDTGGEPAAAKPAPAPKPVKPPPPQRGRGSAPGRVPPPQVASLPGLDRLMPNALRLAEEGYGSEPAEPQQQADARTERPDPRGGGGMWIPSSGPIGTLDFLPDVREGDITLLNTKAEVFAPFVRRVAMRVFQNFWISLKREMGGAGLAAAETIEAEAIMNPRGEMVRFNITKRSARISLASDRRLQQACNDGFFDRNPPPGARATDGNIHFILRTNVEVGPSPRGWSGYVEFMAGLL